MFHGLGRLHGAELPRDQLLGAVAEQIGEMPVDAHPRALEAHVGDADRRLVERRAIGTLAFDERGLHLCSLLQIVHEPLLRALDLAAHRVERAREAADLVAPVAVHAMLVVAGGKRFGGAREVDERTGHLPAEERHEDHRAPHERQGDDQRAAQEALARSDDVLHRKLDPDTPRRVADFADRAEPHVALRRFVAEAAALADVDRRRHDQPRQVRPREIADGAKQHHGAAADETIEDVRHRRHRDRPPHAEPAERHGRIRVVLGRDHWLDGIGEHDPAGFEEAHRGARAMADPSARAPAHRRERPA